MPRLDDVQRAALADWWNLAQGAVSDGWTTAQLVSVANYLADQADRTISFQENQAIAVLYGYAKRMANAADEFTSASPEATVTPDMIGVPPWARDEQVMNTTPIWHAVFEFTYIDQAGNEQTDWRTSVFDITHPLPDTISAEIDDMQADAEAMAAKYEVELVSISPVRILAV